MPLIFGGQGVGIDLRGQATEEFTLQGGQVYMVPAGAWNLCMGPYLIVQELDPVQGVWQRVGSFGQQHRVQSDGANFRVANQTGCIVGGIVTTAGSAYTSAPTITPAAGGGIFAACMGSAITTTVTVTAGGSGYTYPPFVVFSAPPYPGIPATGYCTLSAGAVSTVTVTDQGAGYLAAPTVTFINDPREGLNGIATGSGATAITALTASGTVTGIVCLDHGNPVTTTSTASLPANFTVGSGSAVITPIMCWTMVSFTITSNGTSGVPATGLIYATGTGTGFYTTNASVLTNPSSTSNLVQTRRSFILPTSAGTITAVGTVVDGGIYSGVNTSVALFQQVSSTAVGGAVSLTAPTFGPIADQFYLYPA